MKAKEKAMSLYVMNAYGLQHLNHISYLENYSFIVEDKHHLMITAFSTYVSYKNSFLKEWKQQQ